MKAAGPDVTLNVALRLAPGATGPAKVVEPEATAVHPCGEEMLNFTFDAGSPEVFVNVTVVPCDDLGANVCNPGGVAPADAGPTLTCATSYFAAVTFACTNWSIASVGNVPAAVIAPS